MRGPWLMDDERKGEGWETAHALTFAIFLGLVVSLFLGWPSFSVFPISRRRSAYLDFMGHFLIPRLLGDSISFLLGHDYVLLCARCRHI